MAGRSRDVNAPVDVITEPCRQAIRLELNRRGWSQADLARHVGLSQKHVSQALSGRVAGYGGLGLMLFALGLEVRIVRGSS